MKWERIFESGKTVVEMTITAWGKASRFWFAIITCEVDINRFSWVLERRRSPNTERNSEKEDGIVGRPIFCNFKSIHSIILYSFIHQISRQKVSIEALYVMDTCPRPVEEQSMKWHLS